MRLIKMLRAPFAILAVVLMIGDAHAQRYGPPAYLTGDLWVFSTGQSTWVQRVIRADEERVVMFGVPLMGCASCPYFFDKNLVLERVERRDSTAPNPTDTRFIPIGSGWKLWDSPLEAGKTWRISARGWLWGRLNTYDIDCKMEAYEEVQTKAGPFKTFRVFRSWSSTATHDSRGGRWNDTVWFAPEAKNVAKFTSREAGDQPFELIWYSVGPQPVGPTIEPQLLVGEWAGKWQGPTEQNTFSMTVSKASMAGRIEGKLFFRSARMTAPDLNRELEFTGRLVGNVFYGSAPTGRDTPPLGWTFRVGQEGPKMDGVVGRVYVQLEKK